MKIFYDQNSGNVIAWTPDGISALLRANLDGVPYIEIDEVQGNAALLRDIKNTIGRLNAAEQPKYYVQANELYDRDGWQEHIEDII